MLKLQCMAIRLNNASSEFFSDEWPYICSVAKLEKLRCLCMDKIGNNNYTFHGKELSELDNADRYEGTSPTINMVSLNQPISYNE